MQRLLIAFFLVIIYSVPAIADNMVIPPLPSLNRVSNTIPFGSDKIYDAHYQQIFSSSIFTEPIFIEKLALFLTSQVHILLL